MDRSSSCDCMEEGLVGEFVERPWGGYEVLVSEPEFVVKKLIFKGGFIRPQKHFYRDEYWVVISGNILCHLQKLNSKEGTSYLLQANDSVYIGLGDIHWAGG